MGLEISAIPTDSGSLRGEGSTEHPNSGEMGLEISGLDITGGSTVESTTVSVSTATPDNIFEIPEGQETLTFEEIERLKKLNQTGTTVIFASTTSEEGGSSIASTTPVSLATETGAGSMVGLEISGINIETTEPTVTATTSGTPEPNEHGLEISGFTQEWETSQVTESVTSSTVVSTQEPEPTTVAPTSETTEVSSTKAPESTTAAEVSSPSTTEAEISSTSIPESTTEAEVSSPSTPESTTEAEVSSQSTPESTTEAEVSSPSTTEAEVSSTSTPESTTEAEVSSPSTPESTTEQFVSSSTVVFSTASTTESTTPETSTSEAPTTESSTQEQSTEASSTTPQLSTEPSSPSTEPSTSVPSTESIIVSEPTSTTEQPSSSSIQSTESSSPTPPESTTAFATSFSPSSSAGPPSHTPPIEIDLGETDRTLSTEEAITRTTEQFTVAPLTATLPSTKKCISNDECGNDAYCERRSGVCRCRPGFRGEPPNSVCQDVDECEEDLDDCHSSSRCVNYHGGYQCLCAIGYRKTLSGDCEDIDECKESNGTLCDKNAQCRNLPGAYLCECNPGYTGDGYTCISIEKRHCNQKEWVKSDCGRNHICLVDGHGNIDCDLCKNGFRVKNGVCSGMLFIFLKHNTLHF